VKTTDPLVEFSNGTTPKLAFPDCTWLKTSSIVVCGEKVWLSESKALSVACSQYESCGFGSNRDSSWKNNESVILLEHVENFHARLPMFSSSCNYVPSFRILSWVLSLT
jgi:hypothetical protein